MKKISVAIATRNEEQNIVDCLESVKWVDEIIIFDQQSIDATVRLAKKYTKYVSVVEYDPMFHKTKQMAIDKATGDWIISLDADERITPQLKSEIIHTLDIPNAFDGFKIPRKSFIFGKWMEHTGWYPDYQVKLFKKGKGKYPCKTVHELIEIEGDIGTLKNDLLHIHYTSLTQFIERLNRYTTNDANYLFASNEKITWEDAIRFPVEEFLRRYFLWRGYKDGLHGLVLSLLQALSRAVVFAKLWEKEKFWEKNILTDDLSKVISKELKQGNYWMNTYRIDEEKNAIKKHFFRLQRKLTS